jgi:hypothetical protein
VTHFYKYAKPDVALTILTNRTLRWSTPPTLNDPFDMQFAFQLRADPKKVRALALEKYWQHHYGELRELPLNRLGLMVRIARGKLSQMPREKFEATFGGAIDAGMDRAFRDMAMHSRAIQSHFENDKILCLSEIPDSILMWSYYANNHTGVVLRFTDQTDDNPLSEARPVRYVDQVPSLFDDEQLSDMLSGYDPRSVENIMEEVVWTKCNVWAHEREWRVYTGQGRTKDQFEDVLFGVQELDGVIFGMRTVEKDRDAILEVVNKNYPHVAFFQANPCPDKYGLVIEQFG